MSGEKVVGLLFWQPACDRVAEFMRSTGMPCFVEALNTAWGACFLEDGYLDRPPQRAAVSELSRVVPLLHFRHAEDFSWEYGVFDGGVEAAWIREDYELPYAVADELAAARGVYPSSFWEKHADEVLRSPEYGAAYRAQFARRNVAAFAAFGLDQARIEALDALLAGDDPEDGFGHPDRFREIVGVTALRHKSFEGYMFEETHPEWASTKTQTLQEAVASGRIFRLP